MKCKFTKRSYDSSRKKEFDVIERLLEACESISEVSYPSHMRVLGMLFPVPSSLRRILLRFAICMLPFFFYSYPKAEKGSLLLIRLSTFVRWAQCRVALNMKIRIFPLKNRRK